MNKYLPVVIALVLLAGSQWSGEAETTNYVGTIRTIFATNANLTAKEVATVVKLARVHGMKSVAQVKTFDYLPCGGRAIEVASPDIITGRKVAWQTLTVNRNGWLEVPISAKPAPSDSTGRFWVSPEEKVRSNEQVIFHTVKGTLRVYVEPAISLAVADKMIKAFTTGAIHYPKGAFLLLFQRDFEQADHAHPDWLQPDDLGRPGHYRVTFAGSLFEYEFILDGNGVEILSERQVFI